MGKCPKLWQTARERPDKSLSMRGGEMRRDWDLIIFDCDGVLIDSEVLSAEVLISLLAEEGTEIDFDHVRRHFLGRSFPTVAKHIRQEFGLALPDDFESLYRSRLLERFETELRPMPGVSEVLAALTAQHVPICVATSSSPARATRSLAITGLAPAFGESVFTASQVAHGKPAPDLFLFAARQMAADPVRTLVIEDSLAGLDAARAADMAAVHFTGGSHFDGARPEARPGIPTLDHWDDFATLLEMGVLAQEARS